MHPDKTLGFRFSDESQAFTTRGRPYALRGRDRLFSKHLIRNKDTMADGYAGGLAVWWTFGRA